MKAHAQLVLAAASIAVLLAAPSSSAQTLYGLDPAAGVTVEFDLAPGFTCPPAAPLVATWPYAAVPGICLPPGPIIGTGAVPPGILGDIAVDRILDVIYVTDGFGMQEFAGGSPGTPPGSPINSYLLPPIPIGLGTMGAIVGMGMDPTGALTAGAPTVWVTDGAAIAGLTPFPAFGACVPPTIVVPAFAHGLGAVMLSDITWDPASGTLWACDTAGVVWNVAPIVGGVAAGGSFVAIGCGLAPPLTGIAWDLASPGIAGFPGNQPAPSLFVTDGGLVEYVDVTTGLPPAVSPFYASGGPCLPTAVPLNGLAFATHAPKWGAPPGGTAIFSFGQSSAPGPTFGIGMTGGTAGSDVWIFFGVNAPAVASGGFFCPPIPSLGSLLYADIFAPPGSLIFLGAMPASGTFVLPSPIGAAPVGVLVFPQFLEDLSNGAGGPYTLTDPLVITVSSP